MGTDVSSIAALATQLANIRNEQAIGIAVLKKALEGVTTLEEVLRVTRAD